MNNFEEISEFSLKKCVKCPKFKFDFNRGITICEICEHSFEELNNLRGRYRKGRTYFHIETMGELILISVWKDGVKFNEDEANFNDIPKLKKKLEVLEKVL